MATEFLIPANDMIEVTTGAGADVAIVGNDLYVAVTPTDTDATLGVETAAGKLQQWTVRRGWNRMVAIKKILSSAHASKPSTAGIKIQVARRG